MYHLPVPELDPRERSVGVRHTILTYAGCYPNRATMNWGDLAFRVPVDLGGGA
jgi:hypothetical protein